MWFSDQKKGLIFFSSMLQVYLRILYVVVLLSKANLIASMPFSFLFPIMALSCRSHGARRKDRSMEKNITSFVNLWHYREKIHNQVVGMVGTICVTGEAVERPLAFD